MAEPFPLLARSELGPAGVREVDTPHGTLAVGISRGEPFAVSNICRHQFARLGRGLVAEDGCLQCPWHRARFDVRTGEMVRGPQGRIFGFGLYSRFVQAQGNTVWPLRRHRVEDRGGVLYLLD